MRLLRTGDRRLWLLLGLIVGVGLENKWNVAFFAFGLVVGLLLTPQRRLLHSWWVLAGGALALAIWAPDLVWQAAHGWPQFQVFSALQQDAGHNRSVYLPAQFLFVGLSLAPVWIAGLVWLFRSPQARAPTAPLAWMFVFILTLFFVLGGKPYYPGGTYTVLLAAGAVPVGRFLRDPRRRVLRPAPAIALIVVVAALLLPVALPLLPEKTLATVPVQNINYDLGEQIAWPRFVATVGRCLSVPAARGAPDRGDPDRELRGGGRHRPLRPVRGSARGLQRPQQLLALGAAAGAAGRHDRGEPRSGTAATLLLQRAQGRHLHERARRGERRAGRLDLRVQRPTRALGAHLAGRSQLRLSQSHLGERRRGQ